MKTNPLFIATASRRCNMFKFRFLLVAALFLGVANFSVADENCFLFPSSLKRTYQGYDNRTKTQFSVYIFSDCSVSIRDLPRYSSKFDYQTATVSNPYYLSANANGGREKLLLQWSMNGPYLELLKNGYVKEGWFLK